MIDWASRSTTRKPDFGRPTAMAAHGHLPASWGCLRSLPNLAVPKPRSEKLFLLPVDGSDSNWYKNVLKTPTRRRRGSPH
jgi:hypothetical protein